MSRCVAVTIIDMATEDYEPLVVPELEHSLVVETLRPWAVLKKTLKRFRPHGNKIIEQYIRLCRMHNF